MCHKGPWNVQSTALQLTEFHEGAAVVLSGSVMPVVPVICGHCGYVVLITAFGTGLLQNPNLPEPEAEKND